MKKPRRDYLFLIRDVLLLARYPLTITDIIHGANVTSRKARHIIIHLTSKDYLSKVGRAPRTRGIFYQRTKDGIALQIKINEIEEMLK